MRFRSTSRVSFLLFQYSHARYPAKITATTPALIIMSLIITAGMPNRLFVVSLVARVKKMDPATDNAPTQGFFFSSSSKNFPISSSSEFF